MSKSIHPKSYSFAHKSGAIAAVVLATFLFAPPARAAEIGWRRDLQATYREAAIKNKPILVVVGARWCGYCRQLHEQTLHNTAVMSRINSQFLPVLIDADEQAELTQQLQVEMLPTVLVISPERRVLNRSTGFQTVAQLDSRLAQFKPAVPKPTTHRKATETRQSFSLVNPQ